MELDLTGQPFVIGLLVFAVVSLAGVIAVLYRKGEARVHKLFDLHQQNGERWQLLTTSLTELRRAVEAAKDVSISLAESNSQAMVGQAQLVERFEGVAAGLKRVEDEIRRGEKKAR